MARLLVTREYQGKSEDDDDTCIFLFKTVEDACTAQRLVMYMAEPFLDEMICTSTVTA